MRFKRFLSFNAFSLPGCAERAIKAKVHRVWQALQCFALTGGLSAASFLLFRADISRADPSAADGQAKAHATERMTTVVDLQSFRTVHSIDFSLPNGSTATVTLINLNPRINRWYILQLMREGKTVAEAYHLENPYPEFQYLVLDEKEPDRLVIIRNGESLHCPPWQFSGDSEFETAKRSRQVFAPLCNGKLYLRNPARGHRTAIETVTYFLRDNLPGGESVIGFVRDTFFQDAFRENTRTTAASMVPPTIPLPDFPAPAAIDPLYADRLITPAGLGIQVENSAPGLRTGQWYAVKGNPGIFVSLMQPKAVAPDILKSYPRLAGRLDSVEQGALAYLVAFDLGRFDLGFAVGTDHPRVEWSERTVEQMRVAELPGPDGIGNISPLVPSGMVNPVEAARTVATFTGGFKRSHSAFKYGALAHQNHGSHYGFIENGVVLSVLQPGLATLLVRSGGVVEMKTWTEKDNRELAGIVQARQNGVPLIEWDSASQKPIPGRLVAQWAPGNWSGSANNKMRTLRAGAALQQTGDKQFLIYGYFSTATPSAMARVFQAYHCRYAMHLDMNALEHTYLALYHREGKHLLVQHLIQGMNVLDKSDKGTYTPRFLGYPDNRDFFYFMKREQR